MTETPDPKMDQTAEDLASEFKNLGDNLRNLFVSAWESEQRKSLQNEIETGLSDLGDTLKKTAADFEESETGQRIKSEAEDLRDRVREGEVERKVRSDLRDFLKKLNTELEKAVPTDPEPTPTEENPPETE
jgi:gas vesicle protein